MGFAYPADLEIGMWFRTYKDGPALQWAGVERVTSRRTGRHLVRVLVASGGVDFLMDPATRVQLIDWQRRA